MKNKLQRLAALSILVAAAGANAAVDITTTTAAITDAGTAMLAVLGALIALSASLFGVTKVYRFLSKKSGG